MGASAPAAANANGLSTVVDTIAAPTEAFERQRIAPTWGWAALVCIVLLLVGSMMQGPAARHAAVAAATKMMSTSTLFANLSDAQKQQAIARSGQPSITSYVIPPIVLFIAVFFNTLFMSIGNAVGRGQADFKRLWCGSMNIAVPTLGLAAIVLGAITMLRGADSFDSAFSVQLAMPSLAMLAPHGGAVLTGFLAAINIFALWGFFLNATMLRVTAKTGAATAYTFAAVVLLLGALAAAGGAAAASGFGVA